MQAIYIDRCTEYPQMTPGCSLVADSKDPLCCKVPQCQVPPKYSNQTGFINIPTPPPGVITGGSVTKVNDFNEMSHFYGNFVHVYTVEQNLQWYTFMEFVGNSHQQIMNL